MILLRRNLTSFEYYAYTGVDSDIDEETGMHTGIPKPIYATPVTYRGNISAPSGSAIQAFDGIDARYTHILLLDDVNADISETGYIVWKGSKYDVTAVRPSMNVLAVALRRRTENHGDQRKGDDD